jgi:hypothetical protein
MHAATAVNQRALVNRVIQREPRYATTNPKQAEPRTGIGQCLPAGAGAEVMGDEDY